MKKLQGISLCLMGLTCTLSNAADITKITHSNSAGLLTPLSELKTLRSFQAGTLQHTRYQQSLNGIPLFGYHIIKHQGQNGTFYSGHYVQPTPQEMQTLPITAAYSKETALAKAKRLLLQSNPSYSASPLENIQSELVYYVAKDHSLKLAYHVNFYTDLPHGGKPTRPYYLLDAISGRLLKHWEGLAFEKIGEGPGGNEKVGKYYFGQKFCHLDVTREADGSTCDMENANVRTVDLNHAQEGYEVFKFTCPEHPGEEVNGSYSAINDAHHFGNLTFDMFHYWYDLSPLSFKLIMRVHYGDGYENAFWNGSAMTFGDGLSIFYPLVSLDISAHEIAHGVTEQNSGLQYQGQSGGINEAFSDISGKAAEFYARMENSWVLGRDVYKGQGGMRYMDTPPKDGRSIGDAHDYQEGMNVHFSSGVFNKAFYRLATSPGWSTKKAYDVFLRANIGYWDPLTNFVQAAEGVINAADELGYLHDDIISAFAGVGIQCALEGNQVDYGCSISSQN